MVKVKNSTQFVCSSCGNSYQKWLGRCQACQAWNTLVEERVVKSPRDAGQLKSGAPRKASPITEIQFESTKRVQIGIGELDRVLGGGLVPGGVSLLGGEPGIGKSTLLLTTAARLAQAGLLVMYISAEESTSQIRMAAERLNCLHERLYLLAETDLSTAMAEAERIQARVIILDSVQTVYASELESAPGSVSQIREVTARLVHYAKRSNTAIFLVGHVTKEGSIAGPRLLEHMVDTVLYFESARNGPYRILRAHKNRFGSTNEIAVFEMRGDGLQEVKNPSQFFLAERPVGKSGSAVYAAIEGSRPLLVEVQALCVSTLFGNPRRTTQGVDSTRCAMLAAVLERHAGLQMSGQDLFINVAGGVDLMEPGSDLAVALAIASSFTNRPVSKNLVCFGEIGLSGELRGVNQVESRLAEAKQLGFTQVLLPKTGLDRIKAPSGLELIGIANLEDAVEKALVATSSRRETPAQSGINA